MELRPTDRPTVDTICRPPNVSSKSFRGTFAVVAVVAVVVAGSRPPIRKRECGEKVTKIGYQGCRKTRYFPAPPLPNFERNNNNSSSRGMRRVEPGPRAVAKTTRQEESSPRVENHSTCDRRPPVRRIGALHVSIKRLRVSSNAQLLSFSCRVSNCSDRVRQTSSWIHHNEKESAGPAEHSRLVAATDTCYTLPLLCVAGSARSYSRGLATKTSVATRYHHGVPNVKCECRLRWLLKVV